MTDEEMKRDLLESNLRRLFGRLEEDGDMTSDTRAEILSRLQDEASAVGSRPPQARAVRHRWVRWATAAAALLVAGGLFLWPGSRNATPTRQVAVPATARPTDAPFVSFAIHLLEGTASADNSHEAPHLLPKRYVSNADVESASVVHHGTSCAIKIQMTPAGAEKLAKLTREHIGEKLALVIDGKVQMTPTIRSEMAKDVMVAGHFSDANCRHIVAGLTGKW
jgi:hypothetical protein